LVGDMDHLPVKKIYLVDFIYIVTMDLTTQMCAWYIFTSIGTGLAVFRTWAATHCSTLGSPNMCSEMDATGGEGGQCCAAAGGVSRTEMKGSSSSCTAGDEWYQQQEGSTCKEREEEEEEEKNGGRKKERETGKKFKRRYITTKHLCSLGVWL
jgi:hypothetical protein